MFEIYIRFSLSALEQQKLHGNTSLCFCFSKGIIPPAEEGAALFTEGKRFVLICSEWSILVTFGDPESLPSFEEVYICWREH